MLELDVNLTPGVDGIWFSLHPPSPGHPGVPRGVLLGANNNAENNDTDRDALWASILAAAGKRGVAPDRLALIVEILTGEALQRPQTVILHVMWWVNYRKNQSENSDVTVEFAA